MTRRQVPTVLRAAATLAAAALLVAGCGGGGGTGGGGGEGGSKDGAKTTLTWQMWSGSKTETDALNKLSALVTEKYPNIKLKIQSSTFNDYWTRLAAQASGGDTGCILGVQAPRGPSISKLLLPLTDERLKQAGIKLSEFDPSIVEATQVDGTQVAVPYDLGPLVMYYNADMFKAAGVPAPTVGWTKADFENAASALTSNGKYGYTIFPIVDQVMAWSLALEGVQPVQEDGTLDLDSASMRSTVEWLQGLTAKGDMPKLPATNDTGYALNQFVAGNSAMTVDGPWQLGFVAGEAKFEYGIAPMPAGAKGTSTPVTGSGFGISATCSYPKEALQALSVLTGPGALQYLADSGRAYPARTAQQDAWFHGDFAASKESLLAAIDSGVPYRSTAKWTQVSQLFQQYGVPAMNGQQTAEQFLTTVQEQAGSGQ